MVARSKKSFLFILGVFLTYVITAGVANADVISLQASGASTTVIDVSTSASSPYASMATYIGQIGSLSSILGSYQIELKTLSSASSFTTRIYDCATEYPPGSSIGTLTGTCSNVFSSSTPVSRSGYYTFASNTPISLNGGDYYYLYFERSADSKPVGIYGSDSSTTISNFSPNYSLCGGFTNTDCGGFVPYFTISTDSGSSSPLGTGAFAFGSTPSIGGVAFSPGFIQWNILQTKFPLNWIFESYSVLVALKDATTTVAMPEASEDFSQIPNTELSTYLPLATSSGQWKITYFATGTIAAVAAVPHWGELRTLAGWFLWIGLVWWVWQNKGKLIPH